MAERRLGPTPTTLRRPGTLSVLFLVALAIPATAAESIAAHLLPIIYEADVETAIETLHQLHDSRRADFNFAEPELRRLGYRLLKDKRYADARRIFELNLERFPMSPRARFDLATAFARAGDQKKARAELMHARWLLDRLKANGRLHDPELAQRIAVQVLRLDTYPAIEPLVGVYRADDGRLLSVSIAEPDHGSAPPHLRLVEFPSGRARELHRKSALSYFTGPGLGLRSPVEERFQFVREDDGPASAMTIRGRDSETIATRADVHSEEIAFASGTVELEGTLLRPGHDGPAPAVVLVHGSGKATRNAPGLGELAHYFVLRGYAVLRYDKRGWGASSMGDSETAFLRHLAHDALSAYQYLSSRDDIDADRIGFAGFSEGAWVAGIAAANPAVDPEFVILLSGGGLEPRLQERYRVEAELRAEGFSSKQIDEALEFLAKKFEVARTGDGWDEFVKAMRDSESLAWYKYVLGWPSLAFARRAWDDVLQYQPELVLREIRCPVLAILGDKDVITPPHATASALEAAFAHMGDGALQVHLISGGNHMFLEAETGAVRFSDEIRGSRRYAGGFFDTLGSFLTQPRAIVETSAP